VRAFIVKEGTSVIAVNSKKYSSTILDNKIIKKETMYFLEDIRVDPIGKVGEDPNHDSIVDRWARQGYYGFELPENSQGYELMLVHNSDLVVQ